ncbi:hypothetical protein HZS_2450, partial [Henneguya salminicola]
MKIKYDGEEEQNCYENCEKVFCDKYFDENIESIKGIVQFIEDDHWQIFIQTRTDTYLCPVEITNKEGAKLTINSPFFVKFPGSTLEQPEKPISSRDAKRRKEKPLLIKEKDSPQTYLEKVNRSDIETELNELKSKHEIDFIGLKKLDSKKEEKTQIIVPMASDQDKIEIIEAEEEKTKNADTKVATKSDNKKDKVANVSEPKNDIKTVDSKKEEKKQIIVPMASDQDKIEINEAEEEKTKNADKKVATKSDNKNYEVAKVSELNNDIKTGDSKKEEEKQNIVSNAFDQEKNMNSETIVDAKSDNKLDEVVKEAEKKVEINMETNAEEKIPQKDEVSPAIKKPEEKNEIKNRDKKNNKAKKAAEQKSKKEK